MQQPWKRLSTRWLAILVLALALWGSFVCTALAGPAAPLESVIEQNGATVTAQQKGDEHFHYVATSDGEILVRDEADIWHYVEQSGDGLTLGNPLGAANRRSAGQGSPLLTEDCLDETVAGALTALQQEAMGVDTARLAARMPENVTPPDQSQGALKQDHIPLLVLQVEFADIGAAYTEAEWSDNIFSETGHSITTYYREVSNGKFTYLPADTRAYADAKGLDAEATKGVIKVQLPYKHPNSGRTDNVNDKYAIFNNAVKAAAEAGYFNFASYDENGDQVISPRELAILVVASGYEASYDINVTEQTVWAESGVTGGVQLGDDPATAVVVKKYTMIGEVHKGNDEPGHMATIGTTCHELGHDLGLMDYYDTTTNLYVNTPDYFSLMGRGNWGSVTMEEPIGTCPVHLDAYSKWYLGFYDCDTLDDSPGENLLHPAGDSKNYNMLKVGSGDEYFLLENRDNQGFDAGFFRWLQNKHDTSLIVWHVDEKILNAYWNRNMINSDGHAPGLVIEYVSSEDNNKDNPGLPFDNWSVGAVAGSKVFNVASTPNSHNNDGSDSGVNISFAKAGGLPQVTKETSEIPMPGYDGAEIQTLKDFLNQPSAVAGQTNGQCLQALDSSFAYDPDAFDGACPGVTWDIMGGAAKQVASIQWPNCGLAGKADFAKLAKLRELNLQGNQAITDFQVQKNIWQLNLANMLWQELDLSEYEHLDSLDLNHCNLHELKLSGFYIAKLNLAYNALPLGEKSYLQDLLEYWYDYAPTTYLPQQGLPLSYYHAGDLKKIQAFLEQPSLVEGQTNGEVIFGEPPTDPYDWFWEEKDEAGNIVKIFQVDWQQTGVREAKVSKLFLFGFEGLVSPTADFAGMTSLQYADLHGNGFTNLQISGNPNLSTLNVANNELSAIDLSGNLALKYLYLQNNWLRSWNLWAAPGEISNLTLDCRNNYLDLTADSAFLHDIAFLSMDPDNQLYYEPQRPYAALDKTTYPANLRNLKDVTILLDAANTKLTAVANGDIPLTAAQYQLAADGKTVTLPKSYLATLAKGSYTLQLSFEGLAEPLTATLSVTSSGSSSGSGGGTSSVAREYTVTASAGAGGSISPAGQVKMAANGKITFTITPATGYETADVLVNGSSVGPLATYTMTGVKTNGTVAASFRLATQNSDKADPAQFQDIANHWAKDAITAVCEKGLMQGVSDTAFQPDSCITRGMVVTVLGRLAAASATGISTSSFRDVSADAYYAPYVAWATEKGIVQGVGNGRFAPEQPVSRQELAVMLAGYAKANQVELTIEKAVFSDREKISDWALQSVDALAASGVLQGKEDGCFDPVSPATRGEFAVLFIRFLPLLNQ